MPVSDEFIEYILDQCRDFAVVESRKMFGGAGLYWDGFCFGLIANDIFYLKVDDSNRKDFESLNMPPFCPFADKPTVMSYYEVPAEVLEDVERLQRWAEKALEAAKRNPTKKRKKKTNP